MFNVEKYIKVGCAYPKRDSDGKITIHIDANIITDEINKEIKELSENLLNIRKILGYDFALIIGENKINFEELK